MDPELAESLVWTWERPPAPLGTGAREDDDFLPLASGADFPDGNDPLAHRVREEPPLEPPTQLDGTA
ncbi:hypothetical protein JQX13_16585 [Archangium violaceum]|uniref:hypothetical protein n=1 Tax=Archangium violaceum TaxID=83451 RepID=UPI00193B3C57|nr:hypothetical protein [Archangium violaceum]QRK11541.1 hypothetical protein JQX13_16585 [Archangium violaceum]